MSGPPTKQQVDTYGFQLPFRCLIAAQTGYGKNRLLEEKLMPFFLKQFDQCLVLAPPRTRGQDTWKRLRKMWTKDDECWLEVVDEADLPAMQAKADELIQRGGGKWHTLLIIDDMIEKSRKGWPWLAEMYISGRHANVSIVDLVQRAFVNRQMRLNCQYMCLGRMMSRDECANIFRQRSSSKACRERLEFAYEKITDREGTFPGFLILDFVSSRQSELRARDTDLRCVIPQLADC